MVVIGFYLAGADLRTLLGNRNAYIATFVRLFVFPLCVTLMMWPFKSMLHPKMMMAIGDALG